jgi:PAS domain S-box-containing protein
MGELLPAGATWIYLWNEEEGLLRQVVSHRGSGIVDRTRCIGEGVVGAVAARRQGLLVNDYRTSPYALLQDAGAAAVTAVLAEPLLYRDRLLGVLGVDNRHTGRPFTPEDQALLQLFVAPAAIAVENARLYAAGREELELRERAEAALREREAYLRSLFLAAPIGIGVNVKRILTAANEQLCMMLGYSEAELLGQSARLLYPTDADYEYVGTAKYAQIRRAGVGTVEMRWRRKDGAILDVLLSSSPLDSANLGAGVVFTALDITDRKRVEKGLAERTRQLEAVRGIGVEIARELDLTRLLELLLARLGDLVEGSAGSIHLWDDAEQCLRPNVSQKAADWRRSLRMQLGEGVSGTVAQRREGMIVNDFRESPYCTPYHREHSRHTAVLAEPLLYRDRLLGVVTLDNEPSRRRFTVADQELLSLFAVQAAVAIENARLFEALHKSYADLRKAQEDLVRSEKLTALGQMSAGIAHDLNNMLAAVLGQVELLRLRVSDPAIRESLNTLETAATDGAQTVRRLQEFARQRR